MINERQAAALGTLARIILLMLDGSCQNVGLGRRMNLCLPSGFCDSECPEVNEGGIEAASPAPIGEFLRIDCHLIDDLATRATLLVFLRSVFEPPVIGFGKFRIVADELGEGIVFLARG